MKVLQKWEKNYPTVCAKGGGCLSKRKHVHTSARWVREAKEGQRRGEKEGATAVQGHPLNSWCEYKVNKNKNIKSKFAFANKSEGNQLLTGEVFMVQCRVSPSGCLWGGTTHTLHPALSLWHYPYPTMLASCLPRAKSIEQIRKN